MKHISIIAISALCLGFTSCLDDNNGDTTYSMTYSGFFNVVENKADLTHTFYTGVSYGAVWNTTQATLELKLTGLELPNGKYTDMTFYNLPWTVTSTGWRVVSATNATPTCSLVPPTFNSLKFDVYDRVISNSAVIPAYDIHYTVDNTYDVYSIPASILYQGSCSVKSADGSYSYLTASGSQDQFAVQFYSTSSATPDLNNADKRRANFVFYELQLYDGMTPINLVIEDIPFNYSTGGYINLSADGPLELKKAGTSSYVAYEDFMVTNIQGRMTSANVLSLTCHVTSETRGVDCIVAATATKP